MIDHVPILDLIDEPIYLRHHLKGHASDLLRSKYSSSRGSKVECVETSRARLLEEILLIYAVRNLQTVFALCCEIHGNRVSQNPKNGDFSSLEDFTGIFGFVNTRRVLITPHVSISNRIREIIRSCPFYKKLKSSL